MERKKSKIELEIEQRITIEDYFNRYVLGLNKNFRKISASQPTCICPFHSERDPSFHYWASRKMVHCFGCGYSANIVKLHQSIQQVYHGRRLSKTEAMNDLIRLYGLQGIIKEQTEIEEPVSVFDQMRNLLVDTMNPAVSADHFDIVKFRQTNNRIKRLPVDTSVKLREFANLDLLAGLYISQVIGENNESPK